MMINTKKPYGSIRSQDIQYRFECEGRYFIMDYAYNKWELEKEDYMKLKAPIKKWEGKRL